MDEEYCGSQVDDTLDEIEEDLDADLELQEDIEAEENPGYIKMDYSLETPAERTAKVEEIIANTPPERLTSKYLEKLADYIIDAHAKEEKKKGNKRAFLTPNRMVTINKRETSFEGLVGKLENGEDGIYNMICNDKNYIMTPKVSIAEKDLEEIPALKELHDAIIEFEAQIKGLRGKAAYMEKKQLIAMRQDQYVIKNAYRKPMYCTNVIKSAHKLDLGENITITEDGDVVSDGIINLYNETHVMLLLNNYSKLKMDSYDKLDSDMHYLLEWFDDVVDNALKDAYPMYYKLMIYKIDGKQNVEIQELLEDEFGIKHSIEYISSLWRNKIPKLIVEEAKKEYLEWYYTFKEYGKWKKCSRCGEIKLAHNTFFSKNKTSKDGYYSICKCCRNKKK